MSIFCYLICCLWYGGGNGSVCTTICDENFLHFVFLRRFLVENLLKILNANVPVCCTNIRFKPLFFSAW